MLIVTRQANALYFISPSLLLLTKELITNLKMKLISWNLNGLEDAYLDERTEAAMFQMLLGAPIEKAMMEGFKPNSPDIIVLQEVVERTFHAHIKPHLTAAGFHIYAGSSAERSYFEIIASRFPFKSKHYQKFSWSDQGRGLSMVQLENNLSILTAHMESQKPGSSMRIDQAAEILDLMPKNSPCIFAGDTNLRKAEWQALETGDIIDAWEAQNSPKKYKVTWRNKSYKARYDRAWLHNLTPVNFEIFGENKIMGVNQASSDHSALRVEFKLK